MASAISPSHCFTVDVEEHFQVSAFEGTEPRSGWSAQESRVERNVDRLLALLAAHDTLATFFVLGWVAERHRDMVRRIAEAGHEIASHGYDHRMITKQTAAEFREDVRHSKALLEDIVGTPIVGYRAPSFTVTKSTLWALSILVEEGYRYDSSIMPVVHDRYGMPGAPPVPHTIPTEAGELWEIPPSTATVAGVRIPAAGGGYLRIFPFPLFLWLLRRSVRGGHPAVVYVHPWEIDPEQPRMDGSALSRFRQYRNLGRTEGRLARLLAEFRFGPMRDAVESLAA